MQNTKIRRLKKVKNMWFPYLKHRGKYFPLAPDRTAGRKSRFSAGKTGLTFLCQCTLIPQRGTLSFPVVYVCTVGLTFCCQAQCSHTNASNIKQELTCHSMEPHSYVLSSYLRGPQPVTRETGRILGPQLKKDSCILRYGSWICFLS